VVTMAILASIEERTSDDHVKLIVVDTVRQINSLKRNNNSPCPRVQLFRTNLSPCALIYPR
jgi:hypothetical protein